MKGLRAALWKRICRYWCIKDRHGMTMCSHSPEGKLYSGLHQKKYSQVEGGNSDLSALLRSHLEYCVHLLSLQLRKDMGLLEQIQRRATKIIRGLEVLLYEERLERDGVAQSGEEKAMWKPYCSLLILKRGLQERLGQSF